MRSQMLYHGTTQITFVPLFKQVLRFNLTDQLHRLLISERPDWGSQSWTALLLTDCGVAEPAKKVYESSQCRFLTLFALNPLPSLEAVACRFVAFLAAARISYGSVRFYFSTVRHLHIMSGHPDPSMTAFPRLDYALKGLRRTETSSQATANHSNPSLKN